MSRPRGGEIDRQGGLDLTVLGLPKTGTTWFGELLAEAGVASVFDESEKIETLWGRSGDVPILVAESVTDPLFLGDIAERKPALEALAGRVCSGRAVLVLREPVDWIGSLYRQYIKRGGTRRFRDFVGGGTDPVVDPAFVNFGRTVEEVRAAMGGPVAVCSFYQLKRDPRQFVGDIAAAFGQEILPAESLATIDEGLLSGKANVGLRGMSGHIMRALNRVRRTRKWNPNGLVRWRSVERWPWHLLADLGPDIITDDDISWLRELIEPHNDWDAWEEAFGRQRVLVYD